MICSPENCVAYTSFVAYYLGTVGHGEIDGSWTSGSGDVRVLASKAEGVTKAPREINRGVVRLTINHDDDLLVLRYGTAPDSRSNMKGLKLLYRAKRAPHDALV